MLRQYRITLTFILSILSILWPTPAIAQQQPVSMAGGSQYGHRVPMKVPGCLSPVAANLIGSDEDDHARPGRNSPTKAYDWSVSVGTPVFSICPGTVTTVRASPGTSEGGYGWHIVIDHGEFESLYAHCQENSFLVKAGDQVTTWTPICRVGMTGMTSWPHVHLNITKGGRYNYTRVGDWFDKDQLVFCDFCKATNPPDAPIFNAGASGLSQPATVATTTRLDAIRAALQTAGPDTVSLAVVALFGAFCLIWWLGGLYERVAVVALATSSLVVTGALWLTMPLATPVQASQQSTLTGSAAWEWAYPAIQQQEGWSCTNDGAYTMGGVTQSTFNRWRAKLGQPTGDVCRLLTRAEAKQIYHQLYWLPAGGDKLPAAVALTVVDHYVNTGRYKFLLDQCGPDVACISRVRAVDYRSMRNFNIYGNAYLNRVQRIANYIQKGNQP